MEPIKDEPAEPGTDDFCNDVHNTANDGHAAGGHHANRDDWVEASARQSVERDVNTDDGEDVPANVAGSPGAKGKQE